MKVNLPRGVSDTDFITASYPADFPDEQKMQWDFTVPGMHNYSMHFQDHTAPECLSGNVAVEYKKEKKVTKLTLTDPQPQHKQGNFNMVLKNCKTNRTLKGLTLNYKVSVMRSGHPGTVQYRVNPVDSHIQPPDSCFSFVCLIMQCALACLSTCSFCSGATSTALWYLEKPDFLFS